MGTKSLIKTACVICQAGCGLVVDMENGEIVKIAGNPESSASEYPLVLTSWKTEEFRHSGERLERRKGL